MIATASGAGPSPWAGVWIAEDIEQIVQGVQNGILGGPSTLTDGDWIWRDDFAYYVARHNVIVPAEFLDLIRQRRYVVPEVDEPTLERITDEAVRLMS